MTILRSFYAACLISIGVAALYGQDLESLPTYYPTRFKSYGIEDGLPDNCIYAAQLGKDGRLNLTACLYLQISQGIQLMQFDGFNTQLIRFPLEDSLSETNIIHTGTDQQGVLYGYYQDENAVEKGSPSVFWKYNSSTGEMYKQKLVLPGDVPLHAANIVVADSQLFVLGVVREAYVLSTFQDTLLREIVRIPKDNLEYRTSFPLPCIITDAFYYFMDGHETLYEIDRHSLRITQAHFQEKIFRSLVVNDRFIRTSSGDIILGLQGNGIAYKYDRALRQLQPVTFSSLGIASNPIRVDFVFSDQRGNLIAIGESNTGTLEAVLQDSLGNCWNYTPVISCIPGLSHEAMRFLDLQGDDFKRSVFVTGYVFMVIDASPRIGIKAFPGGAMRGMAELDSNLLFMPKHRVLSLSTGLWDQAYPLPQCLSEAVQEADTRSDIAGNIWIYNKSSLIRYNKNTRKCDVQIPGQHKRFCPVGDDRILYFSSEDRIISYNILTGISKTLCETPLTGFINQLFVDVRQRVWIGTSDGLFYVDEVSGQLSQVHLPGNADAQQVLFITGDAAGRLWLGTFSSGLMIYDQRSSTFSVINENKGLSNNTVVSILTDTDGIRWVGTYHGITLVDSSLQVIGHMYREDGLVSDECNRWSSYITRDGKLCVGTPEGLSIIEPAKAKTAAVAFTRPLIYLTQVSYADSIIHTGSENINALLSSRIILPAHNRNLKLSYGLSNFTAPEERKYAYRIEGLDDTWNYIGGVHDLALINLPSGSYNILVKGADYRGQWSSNELVIPVTILKYFYQKWWFYLLCAFPFILIGSLWVYRQRSEQRRLETEVARRTETITQQTEELRQLDQAKSRLYTNISHEFRTPLTVISGLANKLGEDENAPELIRRNADNVLNLVNQMLDLRKLETGHLQAEMIQADLIRYLSYIGESLRSLAALRHHQFHFLAPDLQLLMDFDPDKITRIIINLVSNAIKFTPEGGDIYLQVDTGSSPEPQEVTIKVTDSGIGIPPEKQARIFDQFYQVDDSTTRRGEGTGIGLTIVKEFVHLLGGTISVQSRPGHGTTFIMTLPITHEAPLKDTGILLHHADTRGPVIAPKQDLTALEENEGSPDLPLILIVEDNPDVVHYIGSCLKDDYRLSIAMDGLEGIDKAIDLVPELIISDVMMPGKNGFELCQAVKEDPRTSHIPVILLTAKADAESRLKGLKRGADAYLAKPFNEEELQVYIQNMLAAREAMRSRYGKIVEAIPPSNDPGVQQEDAFIQQFQEILLAHLEDENFGVSEMHQAMHISRTQLHNKISALTGKSASQYMRAIRLHEAVQRMQDTSLNIAEVAYQVGFSDPKYFARVFKEEFGVTPSEWRVSG